MYARLSCRDKPIQVARNAISLSIYQWKTRITAKKGNTFRNFFGYFYDEQIFGIQKDEGKEERGFNWQILYNRNMISNHYWKKQNY